MGKVLGEKLGTGAVGFRVIGKGNYIGVKVGS